MGWEVWSDADELGVLDLATIVAEPHPVLAHAASRIDQHITHHSWCADWERDRDQRMAEVARSLSEATRVDRETDLRIVDWIVDRTMADRANVERSMKRRTLPPIAPGSKGQWRADLERAQSARAEAAGARAAAHAARNELDRHAHGRAAFDALFRSFQSWRPTQPMYADLLADLVEAHHRAAFPA